MAEASGIGAAREGATWKAAHASAVTNHGNLEWAQAAYQLDLTKDQLKKAYGSKQNYRSRVEKRLTELEKAGWSLPVYREMILADAAKVDF